MGFYSRKTRAFKRSDLSFVGRPRRRQRPDPAPAAELAPLTVRVDRRERRRLRRALQLELYPGQGQLPPAGSMSMCLSKLVDICPAVRSLTLVQAKRPDLVVRVKLAWWTWLAFGLVHRRTAQLVVRYQRLWCPPEWRVLVLVA